MKCPICRYEGQCPCASLNVERGDWPLGNPARFYNDTPPWMWQDCGHQRPILTTGVFDLFHPGHVKILRHAEALARSGNVFLVVGVDTDERATKIKRRPIMPYACRKEMVEAVTKDAIVVPLHESVDAIIKKYNPCLYVKGGDWDVYELRRRVYKWGMGATTLAREPGYSTSGFLADIEARYR